MALLGCIFPYLFRCVAHGHYVFVEPQQIVDAVDVQRTVGQRRGRNRTGDGRSGRG